MDENINLTPASPKPKLNRSFFLVLAMMAILVAGVVYFLLEDIPRAPSDPVPNQQPLVNKEVPLSVNEEVPRMEEVDKNREVEFLDIKTRIILPDRYYINEPADQADGYSGFSASYELQNVDQSLSDLHLSFVGVQTDQSVKSHYGWCGGIEGEPCMSGLPSPAQFAAEKKALLENSSLTEYELIRINNKSFLVTNKPITSDLGYLRMYRTLFGNKILKIVVYLKTSGGAQYQSADALIKSLIFEDLK